MCWNSYPQIIFSLNLRLHSYGVFHIILFCYSTNKSVEIFILVVNSNIWFI